MRGNLMLQELFQKVRSLLNKLTPEKFDRLVSQAVDVPNFAETYARMCKVLSSIKVPAQRGNKDEPEVTFRKLLLGRCRAEFEKNSESGINQEATQKEIEETADPVLNFL
ncbi:eukaryotic translation initiation factor 4 gamma 3-like [Zootermopsis nevadensis]|uniref:eukaryotic translation initiation factor 4 gamma 3-like n=1 Tax=Zootermopsis nevadensis TaxID=136037 RepID=UPI000B8E43E6|nr:eukaryotic translation initiation factor 4 gamma 3-like [Zootermopsis nevadensis]